MTSIQIDSLVKLNLVITVIHKVGIEYGIECGSPENAISDDHYGKEQLRLDFCSGHKLLDAVALDFHPLVYVHQLLFHYPLKATAHDRWTK